MRSVLYQHRAEKKRARTRRFMLYLCAISIVFGGGVLFLLLSPRFQFQTPVVSGNSSVASEEILAASSNYLSERILWVFPRSNILLFHPRLLEDRILKKFPRLSSANVSRSFSRELTLEVTERGLWGLYCKMTPEDCFYIAQDGVLLAKAPPLTGNAVFRIIDHRLKTAFHLLGDVAVGDADVRYVRQIADFLKDTHNISVQEAVLGRVYEDQTGLFTSEGWYILFDERTQKERALENLALVLKEKLANRADLEYIDIRFEGKVFSKK